MEQKLIVYISCFINELSSDDFINFKNDITNKNNVNSINGVLLTNGRDVIQCIHGDTNKINILYDKIVNDNRHSQVRLLYNKNINCEIFNGWTMNYVTEDNIREMDILHNIYSLLYNFSKNIL